MVGEAVACERGIEEGRRAAARPPARRRAAPPAAGRAARTTGGRRAPYRKCSGASGATNAACGRRSASAGARPIRSLPSAPTPCSSTTSWRGGPPARGGSSGPLSVMPGFRSLALRFPSGAIMIAQPDRPRDYATRRPPHAARCRLPPAARARGTSRRSPASRRAQRAICISGTRSAALAPGGGARAGGRLPAAHRGHRPRALPGGIRGGDHRRSRAGSASTGRSRCGGSRSTSPTTRGARRALDGGPALSLLLHAGRHRAGDRACRPAPHGPGRADLSRHVPGARSGRARGADRAPASRYALRLDVGRAIAAIGPLAWHDRCAPGGRRAARHDRRRGAGAQGRAGELSPRGRWSTMRCRA